MEHDYLLITLTFLTAAIIVVPISKKLGLGSVLGYLVAGVLIGPNMLHLIVDDGTILHFSEFGVVLLLFLIGLELHPSHLWQIRRAIIGSGGLQLTLTTAIITAVMSIWLPWQAALVIGMGLGLSSTAIALQTLQEKNLLPTDAGQRGFAILLFQDIAVIPMIAILPLLVLDRTGIEGQSASYIQVIKAFAAIGGIVFIGRFLLRPALRFIAATGMRELFTIFSLALVIGIAKLMSAVGLSMALGTFLAGMLLADSEYRSQLEIDIEPFKGLLMGLFFIAIGLSMDLNLLATNWLPIILAVSALVAVKLLVLTIVARLGKLGSADTMILAILLSQGGEFAFVLFSLASQQQILPAGIDSFLVLVVALSMLSTPLLLLLFENFIQPRLIDNSSFEAEPINDDAPCAIICGFGRMGQMVGRVLLASNYRISVLEHDANQIELLRRFEMKAYYGDASRLNSLQAAGAGNVKVIVLAMDDVEAVTETAKLIIQHFPRVKLVVRARNRQHEIAIRRLGINDVVRETFLSSVLLGEKTLRNMGMNAEKAETTMSLFAKHDQQLLEEQMHITEDQFLTSAQEGRHSLSQLLNSERQQSQEKQEKTG